MASTSPSMARKRPCFASSGSISRLNPVPTGSRNTRSVNGSQVSAFGTSVTSCDGTGPPGSIGSRHGPIAPMLR